ncbi:transcription elongation factor TFIIS [Coemansia sp. RSA 1933]|nr:transcription elongation factor TFIIS [Coemansia sp. RSA 1933]
MSETANKHNEIKVLCKALSAAQEADNKTNLKDLLGKLYSVRVDEKLLRATGAGQVVGRLRNYEDADIAVLAKKVVYKWKKDVVAANSRATGTPGSSTNTDSRSQTPQQTSGQGATGDQQQKSDAKKSGSVDLTKVETSLHGSSTPTSRTGPEESATVGVGSSTPKDLPAGPNKSNGVGALSAALGNTTSSGSPAPRTSLSDKASLPQTGDGVRDKCIELLYNSMALDSDADSRDLVERAVGIELVEFNKAGSVSTAYRARIRSLCLNLKDKKNPDLRKNIVEGNISVERFCSMTSEEMASKELRETIERMKEENLFKAKGASHTKAETDQFKCSRCRKRRCTYYQMQTRSADEPMTTFVTCLVCEHRWKFC